MSRGSWTGGSRRGCPSAGCGGRRWARSSSRAERGNAVAVCITGMHRSGTSVVARLLHECGLDLGPESDLLVADRHNLDGYWENRRFVAVSEGILERLGAAWDVLPEVAEGWETDEALAPLYASATELVAEYALPEPWGWKDPRCSLVMPFWQRVVPDLNVVVCLRNPMDVLLSMQRRGSTSATLGARLWTEYNRRLVAAVPPERRVITRYEHYFEDPEAELTRVLRRVGMTVEDDRLGAAVARINPRLRHHETQPGGLWQLGLDEDTKRLYAGLVDEARDGAPVDGESAGARKTARRRTAGTADGLLVHSVALRQEADSFRGDRDAWREEA